MSFLGGLLHRRVELSPELAGRIEQWNAQPVPQDSTPVDRARFVVVDVETSGLNPRRDRLLEIGAVALESMRLIPASGFSLVVRHDEASARENILIHGIGPARQSAGLDPSEALTALLDFSRKDLLVAFHADFDRAVLARAVRRNLGIRLPNSWLDLALLAPILFPETRRGLVSLDDWLSFFGLRVRRRHRAGDDAFATGELLLILLARARARGISTVAELRGLAETQARITSGGGLGGA
jgi:DNA polymerase-3 subunit epsilon